MLQVRAARGGRLAGHDLNVIPDVEMEWLLAHAVCEGDDPREPHDAVALMVLDV